MTPPLFVILNVYEVLPRGTKIDTIEPQMNRKLRADQRTDLGIGLHISRLSIGGDEKYNHPIWELNRNQQVGGEVLIRLKEDPMIVVQRKTVNTSSGGKRNRRKNT